MSILSTFKKYKDYILTENGYQLSSRWTKSDAVVMGDGTDDTNTLESNLGAIKGITSDLACEDTNVAASMSAVGAAINGLNNNLKASDNTLFRFGVDANGKYGYIVTDSEGADTVIPFKSGIGSLEKIILLQTFNTTCNVEDADNVLVITAAYTVWKNYYPLNNSCIISSGNGEVQKICSIAENYNLSSEGNGGVSFNIWLVTNCKGATLSINSGGQSCVQGWCGVYRFA